MKLTDWVDNNRAVVISAMVCVTALILGVIAMCCSNGRRYQILSGKSNDGNIYYIVFDKRTGVFYNRAGNIVDYVNARMEKRTMEIKDASHE